MGKSIDIDALLGDDVLELTVGGKTYVVKDVALPVFLRSMNTKEEDQNDPRFAHKQLAQLLDVDVDELEGVGYRAVGFALREIMNWTLETTQTGFQKSIEETEALASQPKNP